MTMCSAFQQGTVIPTPKKKKHYPVLHTVHQLDNSTDNSDDDEDDDDNGDESSGDDQFF